MFLKVVVGLAPANSRTPAQPLVHSPLPRLGENRRKARRLMDEDNDSFAWKAKAVCKKGNLFTTSHQQADVNSSQESGRRSSAHLIVAWEDKRCSHKHPLCLLLSLSFFFAEHDVTWYGILLGSVQVSCPSSVPSQSLAHPQPTHWGKQDRAGHEKEKSLMPCSTIQ